MCFVYMADFEIQPVLIIVLIIDLSLTGSSP